MSSSNLLLFLVVCLAISCVMAHPHGHGHGDDGHGFGNKHPHVHGHRYGGNPDLESLFPAQLHHAKGFVQDYHPVAIQPYDAADPVTYYSWHVHVYFLQQNSVEIASATALRNEFIKEFNVTACNDECGTLCPMLCHWDLNMVPMGPHPIGSFGFYIPLENYLPTLTWFNQRAQTSGLRILFHPNSGYGLIDHRDRGIWMKQILPLDLSQL